MVHACGEAARRGNEVLDLLRVVPQIPDELGEFDRLVEACSRMARNKVGNEVLFLPQFLVDAAKSLHETDVDVLPGLAHKAENLRRNVFRRDFKLTAYVMLTEFPQKSPVRIGHEIVESDS